MKWMASWQVILSTWPIKDILGIVVFGQPFGVTGKSEEEKIEVFGDPYQDFFVPIAIRTAIPPIFWSFFGMSKTSPRIVQTRKKYVEFMRKVAEKCKEKYEEMKKNKVDFEQKWDMNFIERLFLAGDDDRLDEESIWSEAIVMFLAGQDTTATLLANTLLALADNPEVQERLYEQVKDAKLVDDENPLTFVSK